MRVQRLCLGSQGKDEERKEKERRKRERMNERKRIREGKGEDDIFVWETPEKIKGMESAIV